MVQSATSRDGFKLAETRFNNYVAYILSVIVILRELQRRNYSANPNSNLVSAFVQSGMNLPAFCGMQTRLSQAKD